MAEIIHKALSYTINGAAIEVHRVLGPGYLEVVYQKALMHELALRGINAKRELQLSITYKGAEVGYYVADFVVENKIIIEVKAITKLINAHKAQAINYLTATGFDLALLINFGEASLVSERIIRKTYR
jgi:GxxExxY protein